MSEQTKLHKAVCVLTWEIESHQPPENIEELQNYVKAAVVDGEFQFDHFDVNFQTVLLSKRPKQVLYKYDADLMLASILPEDKTRIITVGGVDYTIKTTSDRYALFKNSKKCVFCGIEGKHMLLEKLQDDKAPHLNMYAEENGKMILMTKDHIVPRSKGGKNNLENYQVACSLCNQIKGSDDELPVACILAVRQILTSKHMLTRKALIRKIEEVKRKYKFAEAMKQQSQTGFSEVF